MLHTACPAAAAAAAGLKYSHSVLLDLVFSASICNEGLEGEMLKVGQQVNMCLVHVRMS